MLTGVAGGLHVSIGDSQIELPEAGLAAAALVDHATDIAPLRGVGAWIKGKGRVWPAARDSAFNRVRLRPTVVRHPVEDVAGETGFNGLGISSTRSHAVAEDRLVSEEHVLGAGLSMVARFLLESRDGGSSLARGGRIVLPLGKDKSQQELVLVEKSDQGAILKSVVLPVSFVPMVGRGR